MGWLIEKKAHQSPQGKVVCENCDKSRRFNVPAQIESKCKTVYDKVAECMADNGGQVSACQDEWAAFKACHEMKK